MQANDDNITGVMWGATIDPATLLANDISDGGPLTITNVTNVTGGNAWYFAGYSDAISFVPEAGFVGVASFTYQVTDGIETSDPATVYLSVGGWPYEPHPAHPDNHAPVANADNIARYGNFVSVDSATLVANDSDADGDRLAVASVSDAVGGTVSLLNGQVSFQVDEGYSGEVSFTYRVTDGYAVSNATTVNVTTIEPPIVTPPTPPIIHDLRLSVYGTSGHDLLDQTHKVYGRTTSSRNEDVYASGGNDTVKALGGADSVRGDSGDDRLYGNNGKDTLVGGSGKDTLTGGKHADTFVFNAKLGTSNVDTVADFKHDIDIIALDDRIFSKLAGSLTEAQFYAAAGATKAHDKTDRVSYDTNTGKLYYDDDGKGGHAAIHFATLSTKPTLDHGDFAIV